MRRQRQELSRFISPQVAELITSDEGARLLEGQRRLITAVFCDLRGFTSFAETAEPEEVLGVLREYHGAMDELIAACGGTLFALDTSVLTYKRFKASNADLLAP